MLVTGDLVPQFAITLPPLLTAVNSYLKPGTFKTGIVVGVFIVGVTPEISKPSPIGLA